MLQVHAASCTCAAACTFSIPSPPSYLNLIYAFLFEICGIKLWVALVFMFFDPHVQVATEMHHLFSAQQWGLTEERSVTGALLVHYRLQLIIGTDYFTSALISRRPQTSLPGAPLMVNQSSLVRVNSYKYLGVWLPPTLNWSSEVRNKARQHSVPRVPLPCKQFNTYTVLSSLHSSTS